MRRLIIKKVSEFMQRPEVRAAIPAVGRAAVHGAREFLRTFPQEYDRERKKL